MEKGWSLCIGCFRTIEQIAKWRTYTEEEKRKVSEEEDKTLEAVPEELDALKEAEQYLENCSYQEVATWVTNKTGRAITGMGLRKVLKRGW